MKKTILFFSILICLFAIIFVNKDYIKDKFYELTDGKAISIDTNSLNPFSDKKEEIYEPGEEIFSDNEYHYYYSCLSEEDKLVYRQIYYIFKEGISDAVISTKDVDKASSIYQYVILDNPSIFYVESSEYTKTSDVDGNLLKLEFSAIRSMSETEIQAAQSSIDSFVKAFSFNISDDMSDYDKAVAAYTYVIKNAQYVSDSVHNQNIYSVVLGETVCQGYALMFKHLCDQMGIPCITVTGIAQNEPHAWNMIYVDNAWSCVDPTFGDNQYLNSDISYSWFGIPCNLMQENRTVNNLELLPNDGAISNDYYYRKNLYFDNYSLSQIQDLAMTGGIFSFKYSSLSAYNTAVDALFNQNDVSRLIIGNQGANISYITDEESRTIYIKIETT